MDIQIVGAELSADGQFITVYRDITEDDGTFCPRVPHRYPKETLAIRAAEYDMEIDDPRVLDQILLENFYVDANTDTPDPLFTMKIPEALEVAQRKIEQVRVDNGAPEDPIMRSLFHAADREESTEGLTQAKELFLKHADLGPDFAFFVRHRRDTIRKMMRKKVTEETPTFSGALRQQVLSGIEKEAHDENNRIKAAKGAEA